MKIDYTLLPEKTIYIFASKMDFENEFLFQVADSEKRKDRIERFFLKAQIENKNLQWFFKPIEIPVFLKAEIINPIEIQTAKRNIKEDEAEKKKLIEDNFKPLKFEF